MSQIPTHASYLADVARAAHQTGKDLTLEEVAAVIEAVNTLGAAEAGWQPIDSAPKDGRRVLLWNERYNAAITGQFYGLGGWKLDGEMPPLFHQPTHWMPVPAAPGTPASPVSTVEQDPPVAYLTQDEEGSPCMLFFDVVEARTYCEVGEEPVPLYRRPAPAAGDARGAHFDLWQDDMVVASSSGPRAQALQEIQHYAAVYSQDGPVQIEEVIRIPLNAAQRQGGA